MIIWEGSSLIDGKAIVAIVTFNSNNSKTGGMPQIWILRSDLHPTEALRTGEDRSICGDCKFRPTELGDNALKKSSRKCYVNTMPMNAIFKKYAKGEYKKCTLDQVAKKLKGQHVRLGAYGDPAAVPIEVWDTILKNCKSTGYTHQWKTCNPAYANYCMASCDNPIEVTLAKNAGYRSFFVQNVDDYSNIQKNISGIKLANCPASKEMGKSTICQLCMVCSGTRSGLKSNITIAVH